MKFSELSNYLDQLEVTAGRNEMIRILSELFQKVSAEEIAPVTYLIQGRLTPFFDPTEIGMGEKLVITAIANAYGVDKAEVATKYAHFGDLGLVVEELGKKTRDGSLSVTEVVGKLQDIAKTTGGGAVEKKLGLLGELLKKLGPASAKHLVRIPVGKMRLGIGDPTVLDALSFAKEGNKSLRPVLEAAYNRTSDLGLIAATFWKDGVQGVEKLRITVGRPVRPELAERLPNPEAVIKKLGFVGIQPKYDGFRVQIHKNGDKVAIYSRNLENMSLMFPELVTATKRDIKSKTVILDGEAIAYNPDTEEYLPFQETTKRRRKYGIDELAAKLPLRAFIFDILYREGQDLAPLPYEKRLQLVEGVVKGSEILLPAPLVKTDSVEVLTKELLDNISKGLEGVVVKRLDAPYTAGGRNFNWVKLKRHTSGELTDTVDLVLLGYYYGKGKRTAFGAGGLLAGVYDQDKDEFVTITKIGTGLTDEEWREIHRRGNGLKSEEKPARVNSILSPSVWMKPEIVVEVMADEITRSPVHTAGKFDDNPGYALRFPRIVSFRGSDKRAEDATTVTEIITMFRQQGQHKTSP
ncbi:MAG TPA: ATP-dependent DNA ligase [Patescibacteria group bacterium]|nr:ATP-dependent DNA ligase [Patescibacteria group bacterium]